MLVVGLEEAEDGVLVVVVVQLKSCPSTPGFPVLHRLLEFAQTHIH